MSTKELAESIFTENPTRFKTEEKDALLDKAKSFLTENGWSSNEIQLQKFKGGMKTRNLIIGDPKSAEYIITAHYDTPGQTGFLLAASKLIGQTGANIVMLVLMLPFCLLAGITGGDVGMMAVQGNLEVQSAIMLGAKLLLLLMFLALFILPMFIKNKNNRNDNTSGVIAVLDAAVRAAADPELKNKCCFVLFDNEEWGLVGSAQFAKWCKKSGIVLDDKTNINIDCVGIGDHLYAARTNDKKTDRQKDIIERLTNTCLEIKEKQSGLVFMSDHANFKNSYMFCYMDHSPIGTPYIPNIHTSKDIVCDVDKVLDLSEKIMTAIKA